MITASIMKELTMVVMLNLQLTFNSSPFFINKRSTLLCTICSIDRKLLDNTDYVLKNLTFLQGIWSFQKKLCDDYCIDLIYLNPTKSIDEPLIWNYISHLPRCIKPVFLFQFWFWFFFSNFATVYSLWAFDYIYNFSFCMCFLPSTCSTAFLVNMSRF